MTISVNGEISEKEFESFIKKPKAIVEFFTPSCNPCKMAEPILTEFSWRTGIPLARINALEAPNLCKEFLIVGVPVVLCFENGKLKKDIRGFTKNFSERLNEFRDNK